MTTHEAIDAAARFTPARRAGYSQSEVDAFVAAVRESVQVLTSELSSSRNARFELESRLASGPQPGGGGEGPAVHVQAARLLEIAQRTADTAVAEAREIATRLVADAERRAAALEAAARERVEALERAGREQQERLRGEIELLETSRADARAHVDELGALLADVLERTAPDDAPPPPPEEPASAARQADEPAADGGGSHDEGVPVSIYEQLGREQGIGTAVQEFYERVVADPQLAPYFAGTDMTALRRHQTALLVQVTGGPVRYEGRDLAQAHAGLAISPDDFDRVVTHLAGTLTDLGVESAVVEQVGAALGAHREEIVQRTVAVE
nr:group 1 truncated hemoglobin [Kineococcus vitellinus]